MFWSGLHYDVEKGLFLKVDSSHQVQLGTVYRGRQKLEDKARTKADRMQWPEAEAEAWRGLYSTHRNLGGGYQSGH